MQAAFNITDKELIVEVLNSAEYGVLALCDTKPYAVPVNFVYLDSSIYFHGSPKGKKMQILAQNKAVSFNVMVEANIIPSYFSSDSGLACPASSFFKSVIIDGTAEIIDQSAEKRKAFTAMMEKLQPEGKYKPLEDSEYDKQLAVVAIVKILVQEMTAKFKFGQSLTNERLQKVVRHLEQRGNAEDLLTIKAIKQFSKHRR